MRVRVITLLLCVLAALPLAAQKSTGTIQGTVTDQTGAVVPGAKITAINNSTGATRDAVAGGQGEFVLPELDPATYDLKVTSAGFRESLVKNVELHVASIAVVNTKMQPGAATEIMTVEANPIQVETTSGTVGNVVEGQQVRELPLNGRSFVQLTQLMPGVSAASNFDSKHKGLEAGVDFSVNGNNTTNNLFLVDGANNNDVGSNRTILIYPSVDAIAEFKILRNSYGPEYGQAAGGVVSIVTRGGGNQFHGTAYYFGRNDALNASEFFAARNGKKDVLRRNDFGYNLSGPIKKDKIFFFWNEEWNREKRGQTRRASVPTAAIRAGDFSNLRANGCDGSSPSFPTLAAGTKVIPTGNISAAGALIAQEFPDPNVANPTDCNNWAQSLASTVNWRQENARVDFKLNHANSLLVRYTQDSWVNPAPNSLGLWGDDVYPAIESSWTQPSRNMAIKLSTQIGSTAVNDFQFSYGYNKITAVRGGSNPGLGAQITAAVPTYFPTSDKTGGAGAAPPVFWGGVQPYQSDSLWTLAPWHNNEALYSFRDDFSKVKGKHTFKLGFLFAANQKNELSGGTSEAEAPAFWGSSGGPGNTSANPIATSGNRFADLLLAGTQWGFGETQREPPAQVRWKDAELYFGDNFKVRRNLTVEYGIRYSLLYQPTDASNKIASFYPGAYDPTRTDSCNGLLVVPGATFCQAAGFGAGTNGPNSALKKNDYKAFAPRFGIAWDPFGKGTTSIRAGVGEFFQRERLNGPLNRVTNPPFALSVGGSRTLDAAPGNGTLQSSGAPGRGIDPSDDLPASWQYNFTVEREIAKDTKLELAYVGGYGYDLVRFGDINEVPTANRVAFAQTGSNANRPFGAGNWSQITYEVWNGKSRYDSLQALFRTKVRKVDAQFAYTFSKSLSNSDITNSGDISADSAISDLQNPNLDYGPTLINRPHVFSSNIVYNAPELKGSSRGVRALFGGWEAAGILSYASGPNATVFSGTNPGGLTIPNPADANKPFVLSGLSGGYNGTGYGNNSRPNLVTGVSCQASGTVAKEQIFNAAAFTLNGFNIGTQGSEGRGNCRGPGIAQTDGSLYKNFKVSERVKAQFRLEFFNLFNKTQFRADKINNNLSNGTGGVCAGAAAAAPGCTGNNTILWNPATGVQNNFGQSSLTRGPREIQYALKISF